MSIVASYVYRDGKCVRPAPLTPEGLELAKGEFLWIGMHEPSADEFGSLIDCFGLHPLAVEDALSAHQLPKLEVYGDELFVVALTAEWHDDSIVYGETHMFVGSNHIITIRHGSGRGHKPLRDYLEAFPEQMAQGPDRVLYAVLDFIVVGYMPIVDAIEDSVLETEHVALDRFLSRSDATNLFQLRRQLLKFYRLAGPMEDMVKRLYLWDLPVIGPEVRPYFRDVADQVRRVAGRTSALLDIVSSVFDVSSLLEQQRQGVITRKLAAWAAILATPTAIAGIYGMNFRLMPELNWTYGYPAALLLMLAVCAGLFASFKRSGWL
ncbi:MULTISPECIES: magnesium and cobalt transport protein CorA [unclassified Brevundimonas]|uniref:magnesium and cobalt transport protein CorA n=1 Tax=unclassified Brevundimonas TaxID=2622653 RepID=UPI0025C5274C|nr:MULTISPECIES: magnesium and cobalt transport protein CorA [unclassified Brevundimonas]